MAVYPLCIIKNVRQIQIFVANVSHIDQIPTDLNLRTMQVFGYTTLGHQSSWVTHVGLYTEVSTKVHVTYPSGF